MTLACHQSLREVSAVAALWEDIRCGACVCVWTLLVPFPIAVAYPLLYMSAPLPATFHHISHVQEAEEISLQISEGPPWSEVWACLLWLP